MKPVTSPVTEKMVDDAASGMTWNEIAVKHGVEPAEAARRVHDYLQDSYTGTSTAHMRMMQLRRLEKVINALWEQVMNGDVILEGKAGANVLTAINQITDLMDLKKDRLRDEQIRLTQAQTMLIMSTLDQVRVELLVRILEVLPPEARSAVTSMWDQTFAELAASSMEANASATVEVGEGAGELVLKKNQT